MPELSVEAAMTRAAERILTAGARPYDVAIDAMGELGGLLVEEQHAGVAYTLWAEISDLYDDPRGPSSEDLCNQVARAACQAWEAIDQMSADAVDAYFERWNPDGGSGWVAL